jgi:putative FmdB family regulatory protein
MENVRQSMADDPLKECPECNSHTLKRMIGNVSVFYLAGGFYTTENQRYSTETNKFGEPVIKKTKL